MRDLSTEELDEVSGGCEAVIETIDAAMEAAAMVAMLSDAAATEGGGATNGELLSVLARG